jgi:hypothetical protein
VCIRQRKPDACMVELRIQPSVHGVASLAIC